MSQPPQPPNESPQGGFGAPQEPPAGGPSPYGCPQTPPSMDKTPSGEPPQTPPGGGQAPPPPAQPPQAPPVPGTPPPGGGFGPPSSAPAPEAPQTPPGGAQPGYGYPGPQQPGGYGYPGQQPGGYGYPGQQPPGYGYPGQQPYGQQQYGMYPPAAPMPAGTPPQGGNGAKQRMMIIIAAVVAVVLVVGGGVWFATGGDGGGEKKDEAKNSSPAEDKGGQGAEEKPANADAELLFSVPYPKIETDIATVSGSWATDKVYAKTNIYSIVGHDAASGKEKWKLPLDGEVCAASRHMTDDNKTAVVFQNRKLKGKDDYADCTEVAMFDVNTGKKLWQKTLQDGSSGSGLGVTVSGGVVATAWIGGSAAFDETGKKLWGATQTSECQDAGYGGGDALIAVVGCPSPVSGPFQVQKLDAKTGKPQWSYKLPTNVEGVSVISTNPVVIAISAGDIGETDVMSLDDNGKLRAKISLEKGEYAPRYNPNCDMEVESCHTAVVGKDTLYLPTEEHEDNSGGDTNEIIAFDLATGKQKWKSDAGEKRTMAPLRMAGDKIIAYVHPTYDTGGQIVSIDPEAGEKTVYLRLPNGSAEDESSFSPEDDEFLYAGGRLYVSGTLASESSAKYDKYIAMAFGS